MDDKEQLIQANRAARLVVTALLEKQSGKMTEPEWLLLLYEQAAAAQPLVLMSALAHLALGYVILTAHGSGKTPLEIMQIGALGVEQGLDDL